MKKFIVLFLRKITQIVRITFYGFLSDGKGNGNPILNQPLQLVGSGITKFEGRVEIGVFPSPLFFCTYAYIEARNITSQISIGNGTIINNNFTAIADHTSIKIGQRVFIGCNVEIYDSDFHGLIIEDRSKSLPEWAKPVVIEDDVFIGSNVRVLKGVVIGKGSVVANGSIVTKSIPANTIAGGIPARELAKVK